MSSRDEIILNKLSERLVENPKQCPYCDSTNLRLTSADAWVISNRQCKKCGCLWRPAWTKAAAVGAIVAGLLFTAGGVAFWCSWLSGTLEGNGVWRDVIALVGMLILGMALLASGIRFLLGKSKNVNPRVLQPGKLEDGLPDWLAAEMPASDPQEPRTPASQREALAEAIESYLRGEIGLKELVLSEKVSGSKRQQSASLLLEQLNRLRPRERDTQAQAVFESFLRRALVALRSGCHVRKVRCGTWGAYQACVALELAATATGIALGVLVDIRWLVLAALGLAGHLANAKLRTRHAGLREYPYMPFRNEEQWRAYSSILDEIGLPPSRPPNPEADTDFLQPHLFDWVFMAVLLLFALPFAPFCMLAELRRRHTTIPLVTEDAAVDGKGNSTSSSI